jgi:phosphatidate cytidylyltransferase
MMEYIQYIIIALFILGGILNSIINRNKNHKTKKENWLKYFTYLIIVNLIVNSIIFNSKYFYLIAITISFSGLIEILRAIYLNRNLSVGIIVLLIYFPLAFEFVRFAQMEQNILLFTYLVVTIFDAFSQLFGQLFGKIKLVPNISPGKTLEGFIGGIISACLIPLLLIGLTELTIIKTFFLSFAISIFAFFGDLIASYCKRKFMIKDFSKILPGQGGILDRFDSLIFSSLIILIMDYFSLI